MRRTLGAAGVALVLLLTSCSSTNSTAPDTTTTTRPALRGSFVGPTTERTLTTADPLRVTEMGDSIIYDASPAIVANLTSTGVVAVTDNTTPGFNFGHGLSSIFSGDFDWRQIIANSMRDSRPEVIIAWFGIIDSYGIGLGKQTPEAFAASLREALTMMTAGDTKVLLFGVLPSLDDAGKPTEHPMDRETNPIMEQVAQEFGGKVEYYDTDRLLTTTDTPVYEFEGMRVRKLDLIHLCPDGAAEIAIAAHDTLARSWPVPPPAPDWRSGAWRAAERYDSPPGACVDTHPGRGTLPGD